ncbi:uncharacterized protein N7484_008483 [Penicillium longicatenatum]|uniref:uncharacterized protein n=1 Tax=Penicillium longicatenatum TaxID=1561947 RepID=UPI0025482206|nr:uncharacterized protein N7484_008483 [Penicillium longicatenatum]KAJ5635170.1 hypothetical protein N7484_008483 [Penicillium longicatenatum]
MLEKDFDGPIDIDTLHLRIGPEFFGLMSVWLNEGLVFAESGLLLVQKTNQKRAKSKGYLNMFWAAFSGAVRRTGLIPLFGDPASERGGVNRFVIEELYRRILPTLIQDNALTHIAHVVWDALQEMNIEVMEWPPHSPDLNPIENLWALLKASIYKLRPDLIDMRNNDETKAILVETAQQAWDELNLRHFSHLSETMPHRVEAIIESQGWYTPY